MSTVSSDKVRKTVTVFHAATIGLFTAASSAPTPLYRLYQEQWSLAPVTVTAIFAIYALSLLAALVTVGSLSDYLGRRPAIFISLVLEILAMVLFALADGASSLLAARALQGFATGLATSSAGAALLDSDQRHGPLINSLSPLAGLAIGALASGLLVDIGPSPLHAIFILLGMLMTAQALLLWLAPESADRRQGVWAAMRPRIAVPAQAKAALLRATPVNIAVWGLGGFYFSLMPALVRSATGLTSALIGGVVVAAMTLSGGAAILLWRERPALLVQAGSAALLALGIAAILGGVASGALPVMLLGTVIAGLGFGAGFTGVLRSIVPLAGPGERAGLMSAYYFQSYVAFAVPAIIAGIGIRFFGLIHTTYLYGALVMALALIALIRLASTAKQILHHA